MILMLSVAAQIVILFIYIIEFRKVKRQKIKDNEIKQELIEKERKLNEEITQKTKTLSELNLTISELENKIKNKEEISRAAYKAYVETLEDFYSAKETESDNKLDKLRIKYAEEKNKIEKMIKEEEEKIDSVRKFRKSVYEALNREQEMKEKESFYTLPLSRQDSADIVLLMDIKKTFSNPRIISMLIWQNYYRTPMNDLCERLKANDKCGIYKITNIKTGQSYIGQSKNIAERWKKHAKCGLDIDTPPKNKLYTSMLTYGLNSFSWEILEECTEDKLDELERKYIEIYLTKESGFNLTKGNYSS